MGDRTDDHGLVHSCEQGPREFRRFDATLDISARAELEDFEPSTGHLHGCPRMSAPPEAMMRQSNPGCECAALLYAIAQDRFDRRWLLTDDEREALQLTGRLAGLGRTIVGDGPAADEDWTELAFRIHGVQHMILRQAAARALPGEVRRLGQHL